MFFLVFFSFFWYHHKHLDRAVESAYTLAAFDSPSKVSLMSQKDSYYDISRLLTQQ